MRILPQRLVLIPIAEIGEHDEFPALFFRFSSDHLFGLLVLPEQPRDDEFAAGRVKIAEKRREMPGKIVFAEHRPVDVLAQPHDHEIGAEISGCRKGIQEFAVPILQLPGSHVGDAVIQRAVTLAQPSEHEMNVVVRLPARRHAPVVIPADLRRALVHGDGIAQKKHFVTALVFIEQFEFFADLPVCSDRIVVDIRVDLHRMPL